MFSYRCSIRAWLRGQSLRALQLLDGATARARTGEVFVPLLQRPYGVFAPNSEILVIKNRKPSVVCAEELKNREYSSLPVIWVSLDSRSIANYAYVAINV